MSQIADLLTFVAVLTAVHFAASSLRNWRDAIRLVPIGSIDPTMVRDYKTVPLCFIGGETVLTYFLTYIYGRVWISPKARKQAALCDRVVFLNRDRSYRYRCSPIEAGMLVQATVGEGENSRHIRRSARRCTIGNQLILAVLLPTQNGEQYQPQVRCITVRARARARSAHDGPDILPARVIEWEVIDPTGIGASTDSTLERQGVPHSAFWLVSKEMPGDSDSIPTSGGCSTHYGSDRRRGFLSWCVMKVFKLSAVLLVITLASVVHDSISARTSIGFVAVVAIMVLPFKFMWNLKQHDQPERFRVRAPTVRERVRVIGRWTTAVYRKLEWHGSTRRSLAVGNRIRRVGFWQQFQFVCWEPLLDRLRKKT